MKMFIALAAALAVLPGPQETGEEARLRDVVDRFFSALANKNADAALAAWSEKGTGFKQMKEDAARASAYVAGHPLTGFKLTHFDFWDDLASARLQFKGSWSADDAEDFKDEPLTTWIVFFRKADGGWKWWNWISAAALLADDLAKAPGKEARAKLLRESRDLVTIRLVVILGLKAHQLALNIQVAEALELGEAAIEAAGLAARDDMRAFAAYFHGMTMIQGTWFEQAVVSLREAVDLADRSGPPDIRVLARSGLGVALGGTRRHDEAARRLKEALDLVEKHKEFGPLRAHVENMTGLAWQSRGDPAEALSWHLKARDSARRLDDRDVLMSAQAEIGILLYHQGDYGGALNEIVAGLKIADEIKDVVVKPKLYATLGLVHSQCNEERKALGYFEQSYEAALSVGNKQMMIQAKISQGEAYQDLGDLESAAACYRTANAWMEMTHDKHGQALVLSGLGLVEQLAGRLDAALKYYQEGYEVSERNGDRLFMAGSIARMSTVHLERKDHDKALAEMERALVMVAPLRSPHTEFNCRLGVGWILHLRNREGDREKAVEALTKAASFIEEVRAGLGEQALQQNYFTNKAPVFFLLGRLLASLDRLPEAFAASERAKARVLVDILSGGKVNVVKAMTPEDQARERVLQADVTGLARELERVRLTEERIKLEDQIDGHRKALEDFRRDVFLRHPELRTLRGRFEPAALAELNAGLFARDPNLRVLSYLVGPSGVMLFILSPGRDAATVKYEYIRYDREELRKDVREFWAQCSTAGSEYRKRGRALYAALLGSIGKESLKGAEHVVIVPDDVLHALPFAALVDDSGKHLIEKWSVSYAPSVTALLRMGEFAGRRRGKEGTAPLFAVGAPAMPEGFAPLENARAEVENVARTFGDPKVTGITGKDATETRVKSEIGGARFVHLATHGKFDPSSPMYSFIVLAPDGKNDGLLRARELVDLELRADLVVLSACETARGGMVRGEGIVGLTWALMVAGARACIVTQWQVPDLGTSELMGTFYAALTAPGARLSRAKALREAQLKLMKKEVHAHPYSWAPFVLVGDWAD